MRKGTRHSPEVRAKMSAAAKAALADPEVRAKMSAARNPERAALTPEQRADYDTLRRKGGYSRDEALAIVRAKRVA